MKKRFKIAILATISLLMLTADISFLIGDLVPDANAVFGVRRRAFRRGVVIGSAASAGAVSAATAQQQAATAQQQSATAQQQSATAQQQSATAQQQAAAVQQQAAGSGKALPLGTIVTALPAGCAAKQINGVEYYYCGKNYYRAAFQGNTLVYVTAQP